MTVGKAGLLTTGFVAVFAAGVMTGPTIRDNWSRMRCASSGSCAAIHRNKRARTSQGGAASGPPKVVVIAYP